MKPRGSGRIFLRGRIWWIEYYDGDGRQRRETSKSTRKEDARKLLERRRAAVVTGRRVAGADAERTTLANLRELIVNDYRLNQRKSLESVLQSFRALERYFGASCRAHHIDFERLQGYANERLGSGAARGTVRRELALLHRALVLAERAERATVPRFPTISVSNARGGFFEREQWLAVRKHLAPWMQDVGDFAFATGWRVMEVLPLQWRQVDWKEGAIRLEPGSTKNGAGRLLPFAVVPDVVEVLKRREADTARMRGAGRIVPWVFHRDGRPLFWGRRPLKSFRRAWRDARDAAGLAGRLLHDFRRTAVRNLQRAGVNQKVAMDLVGMKTDAIYRRYEIVSEADLIAGARRLGEYLAQGQGH